MLHRYFLQVMYDGASFHGSQLQAALPTVQRSLNESLSILLREDITTFGASRTDEGVHALCNYFHFDFEKPLPPHFHYKLNSILPLTLSVERIFQCLDNKLNARFDALSRQYRYRIHRSKNPFLQKRSLYYPFRLDRSSLDESAQILSEYDHFETFCKRNAQTKTYICHIKTAYWEESAWGLDFVVQANRFLRGMVRGLVGTQLQVGRNRISTDDLRSIIESNDCTRADFSVAGYGLYLENIQYPEASLQELFLK